MTQQQKYTFYWNLGSQPSRAVKALLDIGKISYQMVQIDLMSRGTRQKYFLQMNPLGQIPFIKSVNFSCGQSSAILIYLCQTHKSIPSHYYGSTPQQKAKIHQYLSWYQNTFRPKLFKLILLKLYTGIVKNKPIYQNQVNDTKKEMFQAVNNLNRFLQVQGTTFLCGNNPSIADLLFFFEMTNFYYFGQKFSDYMFVTKWFENVYNISEVKNITQQWLPISENLRDLLNGVQILKSKL